MNDDDLRAAFARPELELLDIAQLRRNIDAEVVRRRRRRAATLTSVLAAAVVLVLGVPTAVWLGVSPERNIGLPAQGVADSMMPARPLNILLLGIDPYELGHSDTIMIVHVPAGGTRVDLISIERDVVTDIPGHDPDKINSAYHVGGADLATKTVEKLTGVPLDGAVVVRLGAVEKITDSVGGVRICLERQVTSIHTGRVYPTGCQTIDGAMAADLLRQRRDQPLGAYDRDRNAQRFLAALVAKVVALNLLTDFDKVNKIARTDGLTVDLSGVTLSQLYLRLKDGKATDIVGIGVPEFHTVVRDGLNSEALPKDAAQLFADVRADTVDEFVATHPTWVTPIRV
ncbi:LCP family protein [Dactylosporangium sp. McL0621]|uniref:LCP family protein n=1 Tax=Dactylosporangium sp. McL0621 TaxID=3415678 RepID=UPI003CFAAFBB